MSKNQPIAPGLQFLYDVLRIFIPNLSNAKFLRNEIDYDDNPIDNTKNDDGNITDPILFDLNGDGIKTTSTNQGLNYDYNNDTFAEKIAWADEYDGVLVCDTNDDGQIQGSTDIVLTSNLARFDSTLDGKIDINDNDFEKLKILKVDGSILSLNDAGIESINISNISNTIYTDTNNNVCKKIGTYKNQNGKEYQYGEYDMKTNFQNTIELNTLEETEIISSLPDIKSSGTLFSLHQAMIRNEQLLYLVNSFINEENDTERISILKEILIKWTNSDNINIDSRGDNVNAQHLNILEKYYGKSFYSNNEGESEPQNPNIEAGQKLENSYNILELNLYSSLMAQSHFYNYMSLLSFSYNEEMDSLEINLDNLVQNLKSLVVDNESDRKILVYQVAKMIKGLGIDQISNFFDPYDDNCFYTTFTQNDRELKYLIDKKKSKKSITQRMFY